MTSNRWRSAADKVVVITGASAGIGAATAHRLDADGARLALLARDDERLQAVRRALRRPDDHEVIACDVRRADQVRAAIEQASSRFGGLDAVVCNAGVGAFLPVEQTSDDDLERLIETNLTGVIRCVRDAVPHLRSRRGRVVLVSSRAGRRGHPGLAVYSATKAALFALADSLRMELGDAVGVTVFVPGRTHTEFFRRATGSPPEEIVGDAADRAASDLHRALLSGAAVVDRHRGGRLKAALNALAPAIYDAYLRGR